MREDREMKYAGIVLGFLAALVMWPLLPFILLIAFIAVVLKTRRESKQIVHQRHIPQPPSEPMLGKVFAEARHNIHTHNIDYMERCYRQPR